MAAATGRGFGMSARRLKRLERAVEGFLAQLQCAICLCVYDTPVSLPCNHCFCEECIHRALELKPVCPICIMPAKKRQLRRDAMIQQLLVATEKLQSAESLVESDEAPAQAVATGNGAAQTATPEPPPVAARASGPADPVAAAAEEQPSESHATEESTKSPTSTEASIPIANESDQPASADPERPAQTPPDQLVPLMASAEDKQENVAIEDAGSVSEPNVEAPSMPADKSPASSTDEDIEMIEPPKPAVEGTAREPLVLYDTLVEESQLSEEPPLQTEEPEVKAVAVVNEEPAPVAIEPQAETTKSEAGESTATAVAASGASPVKQTDAKPVIVAASRPPMTPSVVSNESRASVSSTVSDSVAASRPRRKSRLAQNQPEPESQLTEPLPLNGPFAVGDLVDVIERTWVGVNKPGGAARILKVNDDGTYDVRYIINSGKERGIHDFFIRRPKEDLMADTTPGRSVKQRARRSRTSMSSPGTPLTGRSAHGSVNGRTNGKRKRSGMVFLCSGFTDSTMQNLAKWAKPLGASIVSKWTADVTHLIVKCVSGKDGDGDASRDSNSLSAQSASPSNGGQRPTIPGKRKLFTDPDAEPVKRWVKLRSLKYLKALVGGRWIVSEEWLHACSTEGRHISEVDFEADGHFKGQNIDDAVRRSRSKREENLRLSPPTVDPSSVGTQLFANLCFVVTGEFLPPMPPQADVETLLEIGGGYLIPNLGAAEAEMAKDENRRRQLVIVCDRINPLALRVATKHLKSAPQLQNLPNAAIVNYQWVLNSISEAELRPLDN